MYIYICISIYPQASAHEISSMEHVNFIRPLSATLYAAEVGVRNKGSRNVETCLCVRVRYPEEPRTMRCVRPSIQVSPGKNRTTPTSSGQPLSGALYPYIGMYYAKYL